MELYGSDMMSRPHVAKCCYMFASGRDSVASNNQIGECSPVIEVNTVYVKKLFQMDRCVILQHMVSHFSFSYGTVCHVVVDMLRMPCVLTDDNIVTRMMICQFPATLHSRRKQLCVSSC